MCVSQLNVNPLRGVLCVSVPCARTKLMRRSARMTKKDIYEYEHSRWFCVALYQIKES
jgi:hypothetical protein